ncbi:MAG: heme ABC transporter permease CcmC [Pseudomonadota bacterium]
MKVPQFIHLLGSPPWFYRISGQLMPVLGLLACALLIVAWVWGLGFAPEDAKQGNSYRIIYLHVPTAVIALAGYYVMAFTGLVYLVWRIQLMALMLKSAALIGAAMTFLALFSGAVWGKPTWGTWWVWDARITSMLILFFLYLGVLGIINAFSGSKTSQQAGVKAASILALVGTVNIPIIYKSVDWWFSLHQPATLKLTGKSNIDGSMLTPLLIAIVGCYVFYAFMLLWRTRIELQSSEHNKQWLRDAVSKK